MTLVADPKLERGAKPTSPRGKRSDQYGQLEQHALPSSQQRSRSSTLKILRATERVLCNSGVEGFSMAGVAREAGVSVGGIYRRFKRREDLFLAVKDLALTRVEIAVEREMRDRSFTRAIDVAETMLTSVGGAFLVEERLHAVLMQLGREDKALMLRGRQSRDQWCVMFRGALIPHLTAQTPMVADTASLICWEIMIGPVVNRLTGVSPRLRSMEWEHLRCELLQAVRGYLNSLPPASADKIKSPATRQPPKVVARR